MLCPKCESSLNTGIDTCPYCGYHLKQNELENLHQEALDDEAEAAESGSRHGVNWMLLVILLLILVCVFFTLDLMFTTRPLDTVEHHLSELRNERVTEAYYKYTSKEFQSTISLNNFREFIKQHPIFTQQKAVNIASEDVKNNTGLLKGDLIDANDSSMPVQYKLIKEENIWKILNIYLNDQAISQKTPAAAELRKSIDEQLKSLRSNDLNQSYRATSQIFQKETSPEEFRAFVRNYPILVNNRGMEFKSMEEANDQANVKGNLLTDQGPTPIEYRLVKEDGKWKIWGIKVAIPPKSEKVITFDQTKLLITPITDQLKAIRKNELSKAYAEHLSQAFRSNSTFEDFHAFIERLPIVRYQKENIVHRAINNGIGTVLVEFSSDNGKITLEYALEIENGAWKIARIHARDETPSQESDDSDIAENIYSENSPLETEDIFIFSRIAEEQLQLIKNGEIRKAYQAYTAKVFRETITIDQFESYINNHPILRNFKTVQFQKPIISKNIVILKGTLYTEDAKGVPIEFDILKEKNEWKVIQIQLHEKETANSAA